MSISELSLRVLLYSGHMRALTESLLLGSDNPSPFCYQFGSHVNGMFILHYPCFLVIGWQILDLGYNVISLCNGGNTIFNIPVY